MNERDERKGVLRLNLTAQARHKAEIMASAASDEAIREFVLGEVEEHSLVLAKPDHHSESTEYLILGKRCVLITTLSEARRDVTTENWPAALRVNNIREVHETVLEQLRPLAYEPDRSSFEFKVLLHKEEKFSHEFVYDLTSMIEWNNFGARINESLNSIIDGGPRMPSDSWRFLG